MSSFPPIQPASVAHILIVEDSPTQALKLRRILEQKDYQVSVANHGREALALVEQVLPTLVITDITMPEMDGYELCRRLKKQPATQHLPVILLTALSDPRDILKGLECGADNFIVKPYEAEFLLSRLTSVLENLALRARVAAPEDGLQIYFAGHKYQLTSDRLQSIDLLLSTYETAVQKNLELSAAKEKLERQAAELRLRNLQMQEELAMARELQTSFLPRQFPVFPPDRSPERSALRFCHRYSTTTQLGGDFFDVLTLSDTTCGLFICDVMGHGVRAALVTAILRGLVEEGKEVAHEPGRFLAEVNSSLRKILQQTVTPIFATAFYLVIDLASGEMRYANAGHPAPFHVCRSEKEVHLLDDARPGPALGVFDDTVYALGHRPFTVGDLVMLFTDGLYEVEGLGGIFFSKEQLRESVTTRLALPASQLFDELVSEIKAFASHADFEDDMYLVGVEIDR